jgi:DNA-binding MarR family transcriptional regulator
MKGIEKEIKFDQFQNNHIKANVNILFTASYLKRYASNLFKPFNVTEEEYNLLGILGHFSPDSVSSEQIECKMIGFNSDLSILLTKLELKNLILVDNGIQGLEDGQVSLTRKGVELLAAIQVDLANQEFNVNNLSNEECVQLSLLLDKLRTCKTNY